ncbi:rrg1 [Symbiodinium necroappetens]|uniref:Rrg1 protein n=1 Tax=Symbiodinium necroappetens TaxID=1628268 RepID=A0A812YJN8_9DINO|nr:rrg1 [Symbiodinium necroappetens]
MLRRKPTAVRLVPAVSLDEALTNNHTIVKVDVEGSEIQLLSKPRQWKNTRLLIFEFSAGRSRHFGAGPLAFAGVLDALRSGGFTHLHLEARGVATQKFWTREGNVAANLDFMVWVYRRLPGVDHDLVDLCASPEMERLLRELPGKLRNLGDGIKDVNQSQRTTLQHLWALEHRFLAEGARAWQFATKMVTELQKVCVSQTLASVCRVWRQDGDYMRMSERHVCVLCSANSEQREAALLSPGRCFAPTWRNAE